jgi:hypothetical protein
MQDYFTFSLQNVGICMKYGCFFAKFPNDFPPSFQIDLLQMTEQNSANSVIKNAPTR